MWAWWKLLQWLLFSLCLWRTKEVHASRQRRYVPYCYRCCWTRDLRRPTWDDRSQNCGEGTISWLRIPNRWERAEPITGILCSPERVWARATLLIRCWKGIWARSSRPSDWNWEGLRTWPSSWHCKRLWTRITLLICSREGAHTRESSYLTSLRTRVGGNPSTPYSYSWWALCSRPPRRLWCWRRLRTSYWRSRMDARAWVWAWVWVWCVRRRALRVPWASPLRLWPWPRRASSPSPRAT